MVICPNSPAVPPAPLYSWEWKKMAAPTPIPRLTKMKFSTPLASPHQLSAKAIVLALSSTCTGKPNLSSIIFFKGTFSHPSTLGQNKQTPDLWSITPESPIPIPLILLWLTPDCLTTSLIISIALSRVFFFPSSGWVG